MATYHVSIGSYGNSRFVLKTTSIRKARQMVDEANEPAHVVQFVKWNEPMPTIYWNKDFEDMVATRGKTCFVGMDRY